MTLEGREFQRTKAFPQIKYAVGWADLTTSAGETGHTLSTLTGVRVRPGDLEVQVPCTPRDAGLHTACGWAPAGLQALEYSLDGPVSRHTFPSWRKKKKKKQYVTGFSLLLLAFVDELWRMCSTKMLCVGIHETTSLPNFREHSSCCSKSGPLGRQKISQGSSSVNGRTSMKHVSSSLEASKANLPRWPV